MRRGLRSLTVLLGVLFPVLAAAAATTEAVAPAETITAAALRGHVYFLASDELGGRAVESRGFEVAAEYAATQFRAAGVVPLDGLGSRGPYFQDVPMARRTLSGPLSITVKTSAEEMVFPEGQDVKWFQGDLGALEHREVPVVYIGYGISEPGLGWDDLRNLDVRGKVVALLMGAPKGEGEAAPPVEVQARYASPSAVFRKMTTLVGRGAAGIVVLPDPDVTAAWEDLRSKTGSPTDEYADPSPTALRIAGLFVTKPAFAKALFAGQRRVPPGMELAGDETTQGFELAGVMLSLQAAVTDVSVPAWNVLGLVRGTDPVARDEYVVVSAHLDSTTPRKPGEVYNGADDDASGCAGVMEVARAVAAHPLRRSVIFALFTGEEAAIAGSRHFVSRCPIPLEKIVADVDMDMIGRTDEASQADRAHYALDSDRITPELARLVREVNERTARWPLKYENESGNSDNLAFHFKGIPGVSFYSGHHPDVNKPTDDPEKLDYDKAEKIARLVYEVTSALGNEPLPWR